MEKAPGVELSRVWGTLSSRVKEGLVKEVVDINFKVGRIRFPAYGSLYRRKDLSWTKCQSVPVDNQYAIGPTVSRHWFENGRGDIDIPKGPSIREMLCIQNHPSVSSTTQRGIFRGPGGYIPTRKAKLTVIDDFLRIAPLLLPENQDAHAAILWHNGLRMDNVYVDEANPARIRWGLYMETVEEAATALSYDFQDMGLLLSQMTEWIGSMYDDWEPFMQSILDALTEEDMWRHAVGFGMTDECKLLCLVKYSEEQRTVHKVRDNKWSRDVKRRKSVLCEIGVGEGWDGAVSPDDYDEMAKKLAIAKENLFTREAKNEEEREIWEKAWPFQDDD
ncbi:uncharacterized protein BDV14DRAFT_198721 [Aspergillus stella-maris]|uniref:uncharacterized protein n=1 Tax=Aspergillus stella-maris TaxID=1810926 RepID=UPI003CCD6062